MGDINGSLSLGKTIQFYFEPNCFHTPHGQWKSFAGLFRAKKHAEDHRHQASSVSRSAHSFFVDFCPTLHDYRLTQSLAPLEQLSSLSSTVLLRRAASLFLVASTDGLPYLRLCVEVADADVTEVRES